ncbi:hypothetical protein GCM10009665_34170 [Kitasatospora nipponensis]|uniref:Amino acid adenylation domain-containing protein n=1 Tax=Kitasatospora nipponensis TaxID=258049 RepID=A0ABP4GVV9_9ACTN
MTGTDRTLVSALLGAVREHRGAVAVHDAGVAYSYAQLDARSGEIAGALALRGIVPGDVVALYSTRSWERCAAVLGAWRVGAGVVSLDPELPAARAERIVRGAGCTLVLRADELAPTGLGAEEAAFGELRAAAPAEVVDGPIGYVIPTSGSTGEPKSVAVPPVVLADLGDWHGWHWQHEQLPHTLHAASIGFDVVYEDMVATWLAGATLVVVGDDERRDPFALIELVREHRVARLFLPVVGLHGLAMAAVLGEEELPSLREIAVAGERLVINDEVREFCAAAGVTVVNQYGPSETHVVTQHRLTADRAAQWPDHPPIGAAVVGAELLCLADGVLRPFEEGEEAELMIAGDCVALGYLGDEALTAAKFRTLAHQDGESRRCYASGDLVRFEGGEFHFLARVDDQLKVNGYRVEPGEVEAVLNALPGVRRAVVVGVRVANSTRLAAAYTRPPGVALEAHELAEACAAQLPGYMVPKHFHELDELPVTANGKVDRARLREIWAQQPIGSQA